MKKTIRQLLMFLCCVMPVSLFGATPRCEMQAFLKDGIDMNAYQFCKAKIEECPMDGPFRQKSCVDNVVKNTSDCDQLKKLGDTLKWDIYSALEINQVAEFYVLSKHFLADGQRQEYLISPTGCLLDTNLDPRELSPSLAAKYQKTTFITVNLDEPVYKANPDKSASFFVKLKTTEKCLACKLVGVSTIKFDFSQEGNLLKTSLVGFDTKMPEKK